GVDAEAEDAAAGGAGVGAVGRLREGGRGGEDEREEGVTEGSHGSAGRGGYAKNLAPCGASPHRGTRSRIFLDPPESPRARRPRCSGADVELELLAAVLLAELPQRLLLDLADALAREVEPLPDLLERER